jgi:L-amino acid N-acyltransferase YncA
VIRVARVADAAEVHRIYAPIVRDTVISFELEVPTVEEIGARIAKTLPEFPWLVDEREGGLAGYAYASRHRERRAYQWSVDVTCYVDEAWRGRGVGRALYLALLALLRRQGFQGAFAGIALPNAASVALHEAVGFVHLGTYREVGYKLGQWRDTGWWQCRLGDAPADPAPPRPFSALGPRVLDDPAGAALE